MLDRTEHLHHPSGMDGDHATRFMFFDRELCRESAISWLVRARLNDVALIAQPALHSQDLVPRLSHFGIGRLPPGSRCLRRRADSLDRVRVLIDRVNQDLGPKARIRLDHSSAPISWLWRLVRTAYIGDGRFSFQMREFEK